VPSSYTAASFLPSFVSHAISFTGGSDTEDAVDLLLLLLLLLLAP